MIDIAYSASAGLGCQAGKSPCGAATSGPALRG